MCRTSHAVYWVNCPTGAANPLPDSAIGLAIALLMLWSTKAMQSCTRYLDGKKFETLIGGHRIVCDQPVSNGGTDAGVTPPELLLASLGACAGHYAAEYLRARSLSLTGLAVYVSADKGTQ